MDHAARYQLLDHATDESELWDTRMGITTHATDGRVIERHRERTPEELRAALESLLRDGHVELYELTDPEQRVLDLTEALAVIADEHNWYSPVALGEPEGRETIYTLSLTESGTEQFRLERERANPSERLLAWASVLPERQPQSVSMTEEWRPPKRPLRRRMRLAVNRRLLRWDEWCAFCGHRMDGKRCPCCGAVVGASGTIAPSRSGTITQVDLAKIASDQLAKEPRWHWARRLALRRALRRAERAE